VGGRRARRTKEIIELVGIDPQTRELFTHNTFNWDPNHDRFVYAGRSPVLEKIATRNNWTQAQLLAEWERRARLLEILAKRSDLTYDAIGRIVMNYYSKPEDVLREFAVPAVPEVRPIAKLEAKR
jgi:flagellar protein FlaI